MILANLFFKKYLKRWKKHGSELWDIYRLKIKGLSFVNFIEWATVRAPIIIGNPKRFGLMHSLGVLATVLVAVPSAALVVRGRARPPGPRRGLGPNAAATTRREVKERAPLLNKNSRRTSSLLTSRRCSWRRTSSTFNSASGRVRVGDLFFSGGQIYKFSAIDKLRRVTDVADG
jgi:hypothetical protein